MAGRYHVFLSHSSADKPAVEELALRLRSEGVEPWLDKWHLVPGAPWMTALEQAMDACDSCAVFLGPSGLGSWQNEEMRAAIDRRVRESKDRFRVIPVLLPGAERGERSRLPAFLVAATWVEFRNSLSEAEPFRRLVCGIRGLEPGAGPDQAAFKGQCPYRGLQVFDVEHAPFFCGREALTEWLLTALRPAEPSRGRARFLAVVGSSGSGKSSLARAGLVAALKQGALEGSGQWPVVICRPGPDPLESLAVALSRGLAIGQGAAAVLDLIASLRTNANTLHLTTRLALEGTPERRLVVLVDQFEELFTLCPREELRQALIANLLQAARVAQGQTLVLLTMGADFYGKCAAYPELAAAVSDHHFLVGPMTEAELRRAIERPAQLVGCEFEPGLIDLLVQDVNNQPGALPLLQHALLELWGKCQGRRLTIASYKEVGQLEGALEKRANALLDNFAGPERESCRRIFLRLTQPGEGTEDTKRRVPFRELVSSAENGDQVQAVVHSLADARLITTEGAQRQQDVFVEVAHEALIRSWSKLREWVEADRAGMRTLRRLTEAANQWQEHGREDSFLYQGARLAAAREWAALHSTELSPLESEFLQASKRRSRRRQVTLFATVVLVIAMLSGLTAYSWVQQGIAEKSAGDLLIEKNRAVTQKEEAERQTRIATVQRLAVQSEEVAGTYPQRSVLLAAEAVQISLRANEPPLTLAQQSLQQALGRISGKGLRGHDGPIRTLAFSPDGRRLAAGSDDFTARLWDLTAKDPAGSPLLLRGHDGPTQTLAFGPDGRHLATGSHDKTARLWELTAGGTADSPLILRGHENAVLTLAFSPDGCRLATGSSDKTVRLWPLQADELLRLASTAVGRNMTAAGWEQYFPGQAYRKTFPELPGPEDPK